MLAFVQGDMRRLLLQHLEVYQLHIDSLGQTRRGVDAPSQEAGALGPRALRQVAPGHQAKPNRGVRDQTPRPRGK